MKKAYLYPNSRKIIVKKKKKNASRNESFSTRVIRSGVEDRLRNRSLGPCVLMKIRHQAGSALRCCLAQRLIVDMIVGNAPMLLKRCRRRGNQQSVDRPHRPVGRVTVRQPEGR